MFPAAIAVITGDLIASTDQAASVVDAAINRIKAAAGEISAWLGGADTRFTRFRGDGWQICLAEPEYGLRAALFIAATLRADDARMETRLSIALGPADSLGSGDLSDASGEAFQLSGRQLDAMPRTGRIALTGLGIGDRDRIIARQMFERTTRWTQPQAEAMTLYLHPDNPTLNDIAERLGITPQAVNYRLGGGGAANLRMNLQLWEEVIADELAQSHA